MKRLLTLFTGQWADLELEVMCEKAKNMGYEGLELACWGNHLNATKAANDDSYVKYVKDTFQKYDLKLEALGTHIIGQCVGDAPDPRLDGFAPKELAGDYDAINKWAVEEMKNCAIAAKKLGATVCTSFTGSPIWKFLYSFPQTTEEMIEDGFDEIVRRWSPILDVFKANGI